MPVSHSVYASYGVVFEQPRDLGPLRSALRAQTPAPSLPEPVSVQLFTAGDSELLILATAYEGLGPNEYRSVSTLTVSPDWLLAHDPS
ncbi:hypothetical protein [Streptomyces sp. NPDC048489]|uniref:hypothetical protein n=1 Tax=Streptomyces sp. NPDC048489 TaxID=3154504 RepID=UPI003434B4B0